MSDESTRSRDAIRRTPRSEIAWPRGAIPPDQAPARPAAAPQPSALEPMPVHVATRVLYVATLLALAVPAPLSSWVRLAVGSAPLTSHAVPLFLVAALLLWRAALVALDRSRLAAPEARGALRWLRRAGLTLMAIGVPVMVLQWLSGPIAATLFKGNSGDGAAFFVVGLWLAIFSRLAPAGLMLFEGSRLLSFERAQKEAALSRAKEAGT